ncbi:MAG: PIG-L family deacetylase, partial [Bacteroidota bacterium]
MRPHNLIKFLKILFVAFQATYVFGQSYFPEVGREAIFQSSLDLQSNLRVLQVALQPGYEDLATLAYFRLNRGARIMSAYVTNGEAGESDVRGEYPFELAAKRREEATEVMASLEADAYFLNMPDVVSASDTSKLRSEWGGDSLQTLLMKLISDFKPDLILLSRDFEFGVASPRWQYVRDQLLNAVKNLRVMHPRKGPPLPRWAVERVVGDNATDKGVRAPVTSEHPLWKTSYMAIAEEVAHGYKSLEKQRSLWKSIDGAPYQVIYPVPSKRMKTVEENLPRAVSPSLRWLERETKRLAEAATSGRDVISLSRSRTVRVPSRLVVLLDSVDYRLAFAQQLNPSMRRTLVDWKASLENLRSTLLGIRVQYSFSETILTEKQLTFVTIDSVVGVSEEGKTEILFPAVNQGWVLNEYIEPRLPLQLHVPYRLLSPGKLESDVPHALYGLKKATVGNPFYFFILHKSISKEQSFTYRVKLNLYYAPRFTTEILTPIVRIIPQERVVLKLTSHSRDKVRDTLAVNDSLAVSNPILFRLDKKESSHLDTLFITWRGNMADGTYLLPVRIGIYTVARF